MDLAKVAVQMLCAPTAETARMGMATLMAISALATARTPIATTGNTPLAPFSELLRHVMLLGPAALDVRIALLGVLVRPTELPATVASPRLEKL